MNTKQRQIKARKAGLSVFKALVLLVKLYLNAEYLNVLITWLNKKYDEIGTLMNQLDRSVISTKNKHSSP